MMQLRPHFPNPSPNCAQPIGDHAFTQPLQPDHGIADIEQAIAQVIADSATNVATDIDVPFVEWMAEPNGEPTADPDQPPNVVMPNPMIEELAVPDLNGLPITQYALWRLAQSGDEYATGQGLMALGIACYYNELYPLAHYYCAIAADVFRGLRSQPDEADALYYAGVTAAKCEAPESAVLLLERARVLNLVTNRMVQEGQTLLELGQIYIQLNQPKAALCSLLDSWSLHSEMGNSLGELLVLAYLGWVYEVEDMPLSALDNYRQAIALYQDLASDGLPPLGQHGDLINQLILKMAEVLYHAGELNEALACYRQVIWCNNQ